ncbi:LD-carboxypeptidase [Curtobacterium flaccumfaciens]|uniref:LD-carboxypeptidase n=1 Tax=Curtobacterium poinsettiae TaxID=159612 RepID=A0A9Q9T573_9MICO|nr:S66 peptidase family protein [Curtobacterium flaccumfaciens]MCU0116596.1 LD-carboxypeptidase [Curtobacterium flaccumfaciens]UXN24401.1 LD-carboxypeptidase [Curtobacterium flaccumfaciens]UYC82519.1 LD-carboxypeptidase [Curtobacterium flaccumfaciens pv. poinsettiae]
MASITYPASLRPGGRVEVPAPSMGVPVHLLERLQAAVDALTSLGFEIHVRPHASTAGLTPASAAARAEDLHAAFESADVVLPPWGGKLAVELIEKIDWDALAEARRWFVGWSDISTLLLPLTTRTGLATIHGANLMDEPYELPDEFERWTEVAALPSGGSFEQHSAPRRRSRPWGAWADEPLDREHAYEAPTRWRSLDGTHDVTMRGRLVGGCLETVSLLAGTPYGDVPGFARKYAPEGTIVYLEAAESNAIAVLRMLTSLRLAGWFDDANGVLIGRTDGPAVPELAQDEAVRRALGDLHVPVLLDFDTGHQPPQMPLVNGALAEVRLNGADSSIVQHLVP